MIDDVRSRVRRFWGLISDRCGVIWRVVLWKCVGDDVADEGNSCNGYLL